MRKANHRSLLAQAGSSGVLRRLLSRTQGYHRRLTVELHGDLIEYIWGPLRIAPAREHDVPLVLGILDEAAARLQRAGIDQWRPGSWEEQSLCRQAVAGELYLAWFGTEAAGTVTLQWEDISFWGPQPPDAGYLHRLALPDRWVGAGMGRTLVQWAENQIRAAGRPFVRLDCMADNPGIRAYYERLGFRCKGEIGSARWRAALFEKQLDLSGVSSAVELGSSSHP